MYICTDCPRKCSAVRSDNTGNGFCRSGETARVARAALHFWEEPPISGTKGSGTVFFTGCNLKCIFCQNRRISTENFGKDVTADNLKKIYANLISQGAHNINLVTPTHFLNAVIESLSEPLPVPVVYNSSGYESTESLKRLEGLIDIYLPDVKYSDDSLAAKYSLAPDYFQIAKEAVNEMFRQVGKPEFDEDGIMKKGVIIRHLVLPGQLENSKGVIDWAAEAFETGDVLFSLMSQFTPTASCKGELSRRLTQEEYDEISDHLYDSGIEDGFMQELSSAKEEYTPPFDLTGVL